MKNKRSTIIVVVIALLTFSAASYGADQVSSVLAPFSSERIAILTGERAVVPLGLKDGVVKGDIGRIASDNASAAAGLFLGRCAVIKSGYAFEHLRGDRGHQGDRGGETSSFLIPLRATTPGTSASALP